MNPKPLRILVACAAVAAGLLCWYLLTLTPEPAPRRSGKVAASVPLSSDKSRTVSAAAPWPNFRTSQFRDRVLEKGQPWLDARRRDAAGLVALWDLTRDTALLDEAADKFPDDFRVCMAMIERLGSNPVATLPWIEKIIAAEPKNAEGHYLKSWALYNSSDIPGALAALRAATSIGLPRENHRPDRAATLKEAVTALELPAREAALASLRFYQDNTLLRRFLGSNDRLVRDTMVELKNAGDIEQSQALAHTGLASLLNLGRRNNGPLLIIDEALNLDYTTSILSHLPDDWRFHPASLTAGEWKAWAHENSEQNQRTRLDGRKVSESLPSAPDEVVVEYLNRFQKEGEAAAVSWFLEHSASAKQ